MQAGSTLYLSSPILPDGGLAVHATARAVHHLLCVFAHGLTKHLPEAQGLISTGCDHTASVRGDCHVQDTLCVASELRSLDKACTNSKQCRLSIRRQHLSATY